MPRKVLCGLIQCQTPPFNADTPVSKVRDACIKRHLPLINRAGDAGVKILCMQELFFGPYFCAEQDPKWYALAEKIPAGVYYNAAAVIDNDGSYLGKYRKMHIPHVNPGFWEKFYFKPGNTEYPVFKTRYADVGVYICYDRHFPEGARLLGLNGAEILFNPSATTAGLSEYLWELEQPAHAVANGYFVGAINRVGTEAPWNIGNFYGKSYFCDPRGQIIAQAGRDSDELVTAELDLDQIREVRNTWQFYRDRRPETYGDMTKLLP
jgi:N-carbamoylputrescine amidase